MKIIRHTNEIRENIRSYRKLFPEGSIAIVPTMGFLHAGHIELIREARKISDMVVVTIFVNRLQFNDVSDYTNYPSDENGDIKKCEKEGVDFIFAPSHDDVYGDTNPEIQITIPYLTEYLCGKFRPGHFEGVLFIIIKLFNIINPDRAFFGKKDFQQYTVIKRMAEELSFPVKVIGVPTVREGDGLAMSSRNARLSEKGREHAGLIFRALKIIEKAFLEGRKDPDELIEIGKDVIESGSLNKVEYLNIVDPAGLHPIKNEQELSSFKHFVIAAGVFCDGIRLIDNLEVNLHNISL